MLSSMILRHAPAPPSKLVPSHTEGPMHTFISISTTKKTNTQLRVLAPQVRRFSCVPGRDGTRWRVQETAATDARHQAPRLQLARVLAPVARGRAPLLARPKARLPWLCKERAWRSAGTSRA